MTRAVVLGYGLALASATSIGAAERRQGSPETRSAGARWATIERPMAFEKNLGQVGGSTRYVARGPGYAVFVAPSEMVFSLGSGRGAAGLRVELVQGRHDAEVEGLEEQAGKANYFVGKDPSRWRTDVPTFARVRSRDVYPGIDLVYHGRAHEMEYDFVVAPGADPGPVRLRFDGARSVRVDEEGDLVVALEAGEVVQRAPRVYQDADGTTKAVAGRWVVQGPREAGFAVGEYDAGRTLVIDPVLSYSTYLGGSDDDQGYAIAVDAAGSAYVTGYTRSVDFPTVGPSQGNRPGNDVFVTKFSPDGASVVYSTYLGGADDETGFGVAVDASGSAYVAGFTSSTDFPTSSAFQTDQGGDDAFVAKLSPAGNGLTYSTYLGGGDLDIGFAIAVDTAGSAYVTGTTLSTNFPTQDPYQSGPVVQNEVFVTRLAPSGSALAFSTYLLGNGGDIGSGIAVDGQGHAYVTGTTSSTNFPTTNPYQLDQPGDDAFVTKLDPSGTSLAFSTYLGGSGDDSGNGVAVDGAGSAYVTGATDSAAFPTASPYQGDQPGVDAFVTRLAPTGDSLVYSTYLGGDGADVGHGIAVYGSGSAYVVGDTTSTDFPVEEPLHAYQGLKDAFLTRIGSSGTALVYSTYLGGKSDEEAHGVARDGVGSAYVVGFTSSGDFPTRNPYQTAQPLTNAFVAKLDAPAEFFTLPPCRVVDTRGAPGPYGGPALAAGGDRVFTVAGQCGVPASARAIAVNLTVTAPGATGNLRLYPAGSALPLVSSINYSTGQTRGNNAIVPLSPAGGLAVRCTQASGTTHLILDVSGYFE
jgi:Beta-propeller repeat